MTKKQKKSMCVGADHGFDSIIVDEVECPELERDTVHFKPKRTLKQQIKRGIKIGALTFVILIVLGVLFA